MEKDTINYVSKIGNNIPKDVKEYVLKRVKKGGGKCYGKQSKGIEVSKLWS